MSNPLKSVIVTATINFTAHIYRDRRRIANEIIIGFDPYISKLEHEAQHPIAEWFIRVKARQAALELAAEFSGMDISDLQVAKREGVSAITIVPKDELTYPTA